MALTLKYCLKNVQSSHCLGSSIFHRERKKMSQVLARPVYACRLIGKLARY